MMTHRDEPPASVIAADAGFRYRPAAAPELQARKVAMPKPPEHLAGRLCVAVTLLFVLGACSSSASSKARPADDPKPREIKVTLTSSGCNPPSFTLKPGPVLFVVTSPKSNASGVATEMEVQNEAGHAINDVEGVQPGRTRSFLVKLEAGKKYLVRCPEEQRPGGTITVSAGAAR